MLDEVLQQNIVTCPWQADHFFDLQDSDKLRYFAITEFINNGSRTEWNPIRSVIIRVITKPDDRAAGVRFVYHEYDTD